MVNENSRTEIIPITRVSKVNYVNKTFKIGDTINQLHLMMTEVTKQELNARTVNAACNCVARLNETIDTAIKAARFLSEK